MVLEWVALGVLVLIVLALLAIYNSLVGLKVRADTAWSDIDVQLRKRTDLIPNLVETVKGYAKHEKQLFERVTQLRTRFLNAKAMPEKAQVSDLLTGAIKSIFAVAENYPQLRASENFQALQRDLTDVENQLASSRSEYNSAVRDYNTAILVVPNNLVAGLAGFREREFFQAGAEARAPPKVKF